MRRFIAVFSLCIFIFIYFLSFQPIKAVSSVDYGEMLNTYLGAAETALALSQGANIDWSNIDMPSGSDTWTDQEKAQYIVQYIGNLKKVGKHAIYEWLFGPDNDTQDVISAQTAAIGLAKNSNIDTQDIKAQLDNILSTQSQEHVFQRYSDKVIARWNEYNTNYINDYLDLMNFTNDAPQPVDPSNLPLSINTAIDIINGSGFNSYKNLGNGVSNVDSSYMKYGNNWENISIFGSSYNGLSQSGRSDYIFAAPITTLNITSNLDNTYYCYVTFDQIGMFLGTTSGRGYFNKAGSYSSSWSQYFSYNSSSNSDTWYHTFTGSLETIFTNLTYCCRNVNIYVDGVLYTSAYGQNISSGLNITLPDAVIDSGTDDGKIVAHPIYYPDTMNTDKAIDIDLDKVVDAIASRIAQGADDITFDDLVNAGAAVKLDGTTLTDADTIVQDVSVPIARARVDTINGVIPTIDVVPPLPPLPPINPGDYSGEGFSGMSVLARIVNTTVQSLPAPVILTFFGVVFGAVILGIIKILHH